MPINVNLRGIGDMRTVDYDPDKDGVLEDTVDYVCNKLQNTEIHKGYNISSDVFFSHDNAISCNYAVYTKMKTINLYELVPSPSPMRIYFELKNISGYTAYGKIYKNGDPIGTERSTNSTTYVSFTEDISSFAENDNVELWMKTSGSRSYGCNFRILGIGITINLPDAVKGCYFKKT
jgi:hypothetical protein